MYRYWLNNRKNCNSEVQNNFFYLKNVDTYVYMFSWISFGLKTVPDFAFSSNGPQLDYFYEYVDSRPTIIILLYDILIGIFYIPTYKLTIKIFWLVYGNVDTRRYNIMVYIYV